MQKLKSWERCCKITQHQSKRIFNPKITYFHDPFAGGGTFHGGKRLS